MERLLVLRLETHGCDAEASLNGVPLLRAGGVLPPVTLQAVHEFTLAGDNELALTVGPDEPGAARPEPTLSDGQVGASVWLLLPRVGQSAHPGHARALAQVEWAPPQGELVETPLTLQSRVSLPIHFPRWRWLDAPPVDDPAARLADIARFVQHLALGLARNQPEPFVQAARLRFEELALAYQRAPAEGLARWRDELAARAATGPLQPVLPSVATLRLRPVAGGRLLECLLADGGPALRATVGGQRFGWPLRLAWIDGQPHVWR